MKIIAYLRVSTTGQAEDGYGLDVQEAAVREWAKAEGHQLVAVCRDAGISGEKNVQDRPGLGDALAMIESGDAAGLVVPKLDRLARLLHVQEAVLAQVWRTGGKVYSCDAGEVRQDDPDDPMRTAMRQMMGVFAQLERSTIAKRLRDGRAHKASVGGYAYGSPHFGVVATDRTLIPDDTETDTVARILELSGEGNSLRQIIDVLEAEERKPKRGARWHPLTVSRVIARHTSSASA